MSLLSAMHSSADALAVFQQQLSTSSNNVSNVNTAGYVRQTLSTQPRVFDPLQGMPGGVRSTGVENARDIYLERNVQREMSSLGTWEQQVSTLSPVQSSFDVTGQSGVSAALSQLYQSFSAWGASPTDMNARQTVLNAAQSVGQAFNQQSVALTRAANDADTQMANLVTQVNALAKQLQHDNIERAASPSNAALDADTYNALEQLSELVPITALRQADGSMTVLLNGQTPLVVGQFQYDLQSKVAVPTTPPPADPTGRPTAMVLDSAGNDISSQITEGKLGGVLYARNTVLASIIGDSSQQGSLNILAQSIADRVNSLLTSGNIDDGDPNGTPPVPPTPGVPLFQYDPTRPTSIADTLGLSSTITPSQLAAIQPAVAASPGPPPVAGSPEISNGIALQLANLATPQNAADEINGLSYVQYFGSIAGDFGRAVGAAQNNQSVQGDMVTQARNLRQQTFGVSLDAEAINILQFQRSYQAASKLVTVLDQLLEQTVNMIS
jgi:flagellar hook-associated protein 1 FlgK